MRNLCTGDNGCAAEVVLALCLKPDLAEAFEQVRETIRGKRDVRYRLSQSDEALRAIGAG